MNFITVFVNMCKQKRSRNKGKLFAKLLIENNCFN